MAVRKSGKVWNAVNTILREHHIYEEMEKLGVDMATMEIVSFGRGPDHEIMVSGVFIGRYHHTSKTVILTDREGRPGLYLYAK